MTTSMERSPLNPRDVEAVDTYLRELSRRMAWRPQDAEDLAQEVWLYALKRPPRSLEGFRAWLLRVTQSTQRILIRSEKARSRRETVVAQEREGPGREDVRTAPDLPALRGLLEARLRGLSEPYRSVLHGRFLEGKSTRRLAQELGRSESTVRVQIKRGLERMRGRLISSQDPSWSPFPGFLPAALDRNGLGARER